MKILETQNYQDMSRKAANIISAQIILNSESVLGLATGSSPIGVYEQLIDWNRKGDVDFSHIKTVNLDEYQGLQKSDEQSYYYFMHKRLFEHVNIQLENTHIPNGMEKDAKKEIEEDFNESIQQQFDDSDNITDKGIADYAKKLVEVKKLAKYKVQDEKKDEDGVYTVSVQVEPSKVFQTLQQSFTEKWKN